MSSDNRRSVEKVKDQVEIKNQVICSQIYNIQYRDICEKAFKSVVRINGGKSQADARHQGTGVSQIEEHHDRI